MLLLLHDIFKRESNKNMLLTLLKNVFAYLWTTIAEEYSRDHLFYLFEATVLNFFLKHIIKFRETGLVDS